MYKIKLTQDIPNPTEYIRLLKTEYAPWAFDETRVVQLKGQWRQHFAQKDAPLDLEIGTGNGTHFAHRCAQFPERNIVGLELKFKPLIQSIRRARNFGCQNGRMARYHANLLSDIFGPAELNQVFIHFPDPWPKKKHWRNRLIQLLFLNQLYDILLPGGMVEFKTDSRDYYDWALPLMQQSQFKIDFYTDNLHANTDDNTPHIKNNFITQFESIFLRQNLPIHMVKLIKI